MTLASSFRSDDYGTFGTNVDEVLEGRIDFVQPAIGNQRVSPVFLEIKQK